MGYQLFFYSDAGDPTERAHVHLRQGANLANFWLEPTVYLAEAYGMKPDKLHAVGKVVESNAEAIKKAWRRYFGT